MVRHLSFSFIQKKDEFSPLHIREYYFFQVSCCAVCVWILLPVIQSHIPGYSWVSPLSPWFFPNENQDLRGSVSLWKPWVWTSNKVSENLFEVHKQCAIKTRFFNNGSKIATSALFICLSFYLEHAVEVKLCQWWNLKTYLLVCLCSSCISALHRLLLWR